MSRQPESERRRWLQPTVLVYTAQSRPLAPQRGHSAVLRLPPPTLITRTASAARAQSQGRCPGRYQEFLKQRPACRRNAKDDAAPMNALPMPQSPQLGKKDNLNCPHNEMKLKRNSFKTVLKPFCFCFISFRGQFNTTVESDTKKNKLTNYVH